ncbi:hypothetical protein AArcSl_1332 [Halalkaliarchaeum desulfuricum]|uniref:Uncharacterized protein n=1 Tax=Halalkaliarchaeum desulfuricum TaxID=2055893 RepID=A0A343TIP1_9EURY|nr:hypothetical protein [Halalkaliarchaeum desulfuricum]AUX08963.1 hypothetical protein AArcSl_1332 [Halalkaliarchaeum desulfuricum]
MTEDPTVSAVSIPVSRRQYAGFLGGAALGGLAGCLEGRDPATVETTLLVRDPDGDDEQTLIDGERDELEPNEYVWWEFTINLESEMEYQVDVEEGGVNAYVLEPDQFEIMSEEEEGFEAVPGSVSQEATATAQATATVDPGEYRMVVMNADILPDNA